MFLLLSFTATHWQNGALCKPRNEWTFGGWPPQRNWCVKTDVILFYTPFPVHKLQDSEEGIPVVVDWKRMYMAQLKVMNFIYLR